MITNPQARLLIVDDEALLMKALCDTLEQEGYATTGFTSGKEALEALREHEFDLLLTDLMMPEMDGISLLRAALEIDKTLVGILMTGQGTISTAVDAMKMGASDYVLKPFKVSTVLPVISRALNARRLRMENMQLLETVAIYELSMTIAFARDTGTILRKMADAVFDQGDAASVSILLPTLDGKELCVAVALGKDADVIQGKRVPITTTLSSWVASTEKLFSSSPEELSNVQPIQASAWTEAASGLSIPMLAAGKLMGILNFSPSRPERPVALGRIKSLNILAGTAASAFHSASLLEELRTAEQRYKRLADNAPDIIFRYDLQPQRRCVYMSPAVRAVTGHAPEDFYADPELVLKVVHPEDRPLLEAVFRGELQGSATTLRWVSANGATISVEQRSVLVQDKDGKLIAIEGIARDITERIKLEEQLRQSQKLEGVGQLAGGIAHDFNNLLTVILGRSQMLQKKLERASPLQRDVDLIHKTAGRAASLTRQLLAFSRKQLLQPKVLDLNAVVADMDKMLQRLIGEHIDLAAVLHPGLGRVKVDPGQMEQVIMNLAVNARDAMPQGGKLIIETANVVLDENYTWQHMSVQPGRYVMLAVTDAGCGMDSQTQARIFEPFFTTKEPGKGTGLGLSTVYGIVKQSGGNIWVYSELGRGTTFKIYLPRVDEAADEISAQEDHRSMKGWETILLVEDEEAVRELSQEILQDEGYQVLVATNGEEAIQLCQRYKGSIELVVTDVVMPKMSGPELARRLSSLRPAARTLFLSGYTNASITHNELLSSDVEFLQKPFSAEIFTRKVREILDAAVASHKL
jgi:PAS domain S-box-containing protein